MKKLNKLLIFTLVFSLLMGCSKKESGPEATVKGFLEGLKAFDLKECQKYLDSSGDDLGEYFEDYFDTSSELDSLTESEVKMIGALLDYKYEIKDTKIDGDEAIVNVSLEVIDYQDLFADLLSSLFTYTLTNTDFNSMGDEEVSELVMELFMDIIDEVDKKTVEAEIKVIKKDGAWLINEDSFIDLMKKIVDFEWLETYLGDSDYDYESYEVDEDKVKKENTLLQKGRLEGSYTNIKYFVTPFEFIDYDITSANHSADNYADISFKDGLLTLYIEVAGNIGDKFYILVEDEDFNLIKTVECTLTKTQEVFTVEVEVDPATGDVGFYLIPLDEYLVYGSSGSNFGYTYIFNSDQ